jgi:hypothetical protein
MVRLPDPTLVCGARRRFRTARSVSSRRSWIRGTGVRSIQRDVGKTVVIVRVIGELLQDVDTHERDFTRYRVPNPENDTATTSTKPVPIDD